MVIVKTDGSFAALMDIRAANDPSVAALMDISGLQCGYIHTHARDIADAECMMFSALFQGQGAGQWTIARLQ